MARRPHRVRRKGPAERSQAAGSAARALFQGPEPHVYYRPTWPAIEAALLAEWNIHREAVMALAAGGPGRPWGYFWFDRPHADTIPGPTRDALMADGRLTEAEAGLMTRAHTWHAFAQVAASRPGQAAAEWLADPALIETAIERCGWNPFTEPVIAYLRKAEQDRQAVLKRQSQHALADRGV